VSEAKRAARVLSRSHERKIGGLPPIGPATRAQTCHKVDRWQMSSEPSKTFSEADVLVRLRLKEIGLQVPHLNSRRRSCPAQQRQPRRVAVVGTGSEEHCGRTWGASGAGRHQAL